MTAARVGMGRAFGLFVALVGLAGFAPGFTGAGVDAARPMATTPHPRCATARLTVTFDSSISALGNEYGAFSLENSAAATCTIFGYPRVQMLDARGRALPTHREHAGAPPWQRGNGGTEEQVVLRRGDKAMFQLSWDTSLTLPGCRPDVRPDKLAITPPSDDRPAIIPAHDAQGHSMDVCNGRLLVSSVSGPPQN